MTRLINAAGLQLIQSFEGLRLIGYRDTVGLPTVGWGHLIVPADNLHVGSIITRLQADALLYADLAKAENAVTTLAGTSLTDNQFAALVSFTFNAGIGNLAKLLRRGLLATPNRLLLFVFARGKKLSGLIRRRGAERKLYLQP